MHTRFEAWGVSSGGFNSGYTLIISCNNVDITPYTHVSTHPKAEIPGGKHKYGSGGEGYQTSATVSTQVHRIVPSSYSTPTAPFPSLRVP